MGFVGFIGFEGFIEYKEGRIAFIGVMGGKWANGGRVYRG